MQGGAHPLCHDFKIDANMPSTLPAAPASAANAAAAPDAMFAELQSLRGEIDAVDDALHDLLMRRGEVVARVAALRHAGKIAFRPGREADIVRRLLGRHAGALPRIGIVRLWRELFAATTSTQVGLVISVCDAGADGGCTALAREHFGALTPLRAHRGAAETIAEVSAGRATAAVLPMPGETAAWWTALLDGREPRIHVVARLPFWAPRPEGAPQAQALVVAASPPDPSSRDRSLLGFAAAPEMDRARLAAALAGVGLIPGRILLRHDGEAARIGLADVDGYMADGDPRLARLPGSVQRPVVLGAYAVPVEAADAAP